MADEFEWTDEYYQLGDTIAHVTNFVREDGAIGSVNLRIEDRDSATWSVGAALAAAGLSSAPKVTEMVVATPRGRLTIKWDVVAPLTDTPTLGTGAPDALAPLAPPATPTAGDGA